MVLGLEWLDGVKACILPFSNSVMILDENRTCAVPTRRMSGQGPVLSAMQLEKGLKKNEPTYAVMPHSLASTTQEGTDVPEGIRGILNRYKDVMPPKLPKQLPPRRSVDHRIELERETPPPARTPYRMAPPELEELRRQLKELLEAGMIQPSKSPFGAPVLFPSRNDSALPSPSDLHLHSVGDIILPGR